MRARIALAVCAALVVAGALLPGLAFDHALTERRALVAELSAAAGPSATLAAVRQQLAVEAGQARASTALLDDALAATRGEAERRALLALRACAAGDGGCAKPELTDAAALAASEPLRAAWARVDEAEARARDARRAGGALVLLGLAFGAFFALRRPVPALPPAEAAEPAGNDEVHRLLRERLEALYAVRTQLGDGARFGAFGELAAALTHGLKTPLAGISASLQLAQLKLGATHAAGAELEEALRLTEALTEQLQRFLRAAGQVGAAPVRVEVATILGLIAEGYAPEAEKRQVRLTLRPVAPELAVECDASLLDMALRNLVENALAVGRHVTLAAEPVAAPARVGLDGAHPGEGRYVALVVEDDGPGLPTSARRTEPGVTTRAAGSGLGLAIARRVAERHQGALTMEDVPAGGARIALVLPLSPRSPA